MKRIYHFTLLAALLAGCATGPTAGNGEASYAPNPPLLLRKTASQSCVVSLITDLTDVPAYQGPKPATGTPFGATKNPDSWLTDERLQQLIVDDLRMSGMFTTVEPETPGRLGDLFIKSTLKRATLVYVGPDKTTLDFTIDIQAMKSSGSALYVKTYSRHWDLPSANLRPALADSMQDWMRDVRQDLQDLLFPPI